MKKREFLVGTGRWWRKIVILMAYIGIDTFLCVNILLKVNNGNNKSFHSPPWRKPRDCMKEMKCGRSVSLSELFFYILLESACGTCLGVYFCNQVKGKCHDQIKLFSFNRLKKWVWWKKKLWKLLAKLMKFDVERSCLKVLENWQFFLMRKLKSFKFKYLWTKKFLAIIWSKSYKILTWKISIQRHMLNIFFLIPRFRY